MALTEIQRQALLVIAKNRSPNSVFSGGAAINRHYPRLSEDLDFQQYSKDTVRTSFEADAECLRAAGYHFEETQKSALDRGFGQAKISKDGSVTLMDWTNDSAHRFFPAIEDPECGWRLHDVDLATNKALALAGRREPRDYFDIMTLHKNGFPLAALAWAAPAKDPGFTPELILDEMTHHSIHPEHVLLEEIKTTGPVNFVALKREFLTAIREARDLFAILPPRQAAHLYIDRAGGLQMPDPAGVTAGRLTLHSARLCGAWPAPARD
jgi:hypothetical protein